MHIIDNLKTNYSHVFDFKDGFVFGNHNFELYARYSQENLKYFGSKKIEIYSFSNNEHLFVKNLGNKAINFEELKAFFLDVYSNFIEVDDKHMSTLITVILAVEGIDDETKRLVTKFKFYKSYMFGLKGFVNGKLIVVDISDNKAYENKLAKGDAVKLNLLA